MTEKYQYIGPGAPFGPYGGGGGSTVCGGGCSGGGRGTVSDENEKKEVHTMQVSYNGFTGELVKLEREEIATTATMANGGAINAIYQVPKTETRYGLSIYDSEKRVTHSFDGVKLEDIKFLGGAVLFGV